MNPRTKFVKHAQFIEYLSSDTFTLHCDELSGYEEEMDFLFLCETAKVGQKNASARRKRRTAEGETVNRTLLHQLILLQSFSATL
jgi:hypothetical protein